jgi:4'-phosphopantetheinyl transferase
MSSDTDPVDPVDLWVIPADQPAPVVARLRPLLDPAERDRADAASDAVRTARFTVVHGVVRLLAAQRLGIDAADLTWQYGPHGKPEPQGGRLRLSYSGSGPLAVLALADGRRVGADVEVLRDARVAARLAGRYFPDIDRQFVSSADTPEIASDRFTRLWCRREACVKVHGGRLAQGLGLALAGPSPLLLPDTGPLDGGPYQVRDVSVPGAFRAAVAVEGARPFQLVRRHWTATADLLAPQQASPELL